MLFVRALLAFLALPAVVGGLVPASIVRFAPPDGATVPVGIAVLGIGVLLLLWCVRDFAVAGRGTLAPWDPPKHLVAVGLYRYVRNPMYLAVLTVVAGWARLYASAWVALYLVVLAVGFHIRVLTYEEPWLARQFDGEWEAYAAVVSRWLPRMRGVA